MSKNAAARERRYNRRAIERIRLHAPRHLKSQLRNLHILADKELAGHADTVAAMVDGAALKAAIRRVVTRRLEV